MTKQKVKTQHPQTDIILEDAVLREALKEIKSFLTSMQQDVCTSSMLLDCNIKDSFSQFLDEVIKDPMKSSYEALALLESSILSLLNDSVIGYFKSNADTVKEAYKLKNSGSLLHYSVVLKDNSTNSKKILYRFLSSYENAPYSNRFQIIFQNIPHTILKEFKEEMKDNRFEKVL